MSREVILAQAGHPRDQVEAACAKIRFLRNHFGLVLISPPPLTLVTLSILHSEARCSPTQVGSWIRRPAVLTGWQDASSVHGCIIDPSEKALSRAPFTFLC
jgi:hypothetical protein